MTTSSFIFSANDATNGRELWVTDGTTGSTLLVKDIDPGTGSSSPTDLTALGNGKALFEANDGTNGAELWVTDGTGAGTSLVKDIYPGTGSSFPFWLTALGNGKALFVANDGTNGQELWVTDGTGAGTSLVKDIWPGANGSNPAYLRALGNGKVLFQATDGTNGYELWVTDGTGAGTSLVKDIYPGANSSTPSYFTALGNGKALFYADDGTHGQELWVTDGTTGGTSLVKDIDPGAGSSKPSGVGLTAIGNGKALFQADDGTNGLELWVTDGTTGGTSLVKDIWPGVNGSGPSDLTPLGNGDVLFAAQDPTNGDELWVTDGTTGGTSLVKDIDPGPNGSNPSELTSLGNGEALFNADDGTNGRELWVTDGTTGGTSLVKDIDPGANGSFPSSLTSLGNGEALFNADDGTNGRELWVTDGTTGGTSLVKAITSPTNFTAITEDIPCFCRGVRILTPKGEVPVEHLKVGDLVSTLKGKAKAITWIGFGRSLVTAINPGCRPVIVRRGALGHGVPRRDLRLTKGHSLFVDGVLIPVDLLVNGRTILWDEAAQVVEFYHVELATHEVLIADGAPAESYREDGNRILFHNADGPAHADGAPDWYAPVVVEGPLLDRAWAGLMRRTGLAAPLTADPDLHLRADGRRVEAEITGGRFYRFRLPRSPADLRIVSRSACPRALGLDADARTLGVGLRGVTVKFAGQAVVTPYDSGLFADGWHAPEHGLGLRWTTGNARLPAELLAEARGPLTVSLDLACAARYPRGEEADLPLGRRAGV